MYGLYSRSLSGHRSFFQFNSVTLSFLKDSFCRAYNLGRDWYSRFETRAQAVIFAFVKYDHPCIPLSTSLYLCFGVQSLQQYMSYAFRSCILDFF